MIEESFNTPRILARRPHPRTPNPSLFAIRPPNKRPEKQSHSADWQRLQKTMGAPIDPFREAILDQQLHKNGWPLCFFVSWYFHGMDTQANDHELNKQLAERIGDYGDSLDTAITVIETVETTASVISMAGGVGYVYKVAATEVGKKAAVWVTAKTIGKGLAIGIISETGIS